MKTKEAMQKTGLTRKAMEYYESQGFFTAERDENGYRNYSDNDCEILREISLLRSLGLAISEIKNIIGAENRGTCLTELLRDREIRLSLDEKRASILKRLADGMEFEELAPEIEGLDAEQTIYERLCEKFPGFTGRLMFLSYRPFLGGRIETEEQRKAFNGYVEFLDGMEDMVLSEEDKEYIKEGAAFISADIAEKSNAAKLEAVNDPEEWLKEHADEISAYIELQNSEEYRSHPAIKYNKKLKNHMEKTGYYKTAIPLLRKMSPAYDEYYIKLLKADESFRKACEKSEFFE